MWNGISSFKQYRPGVMLSRTTPAPLVAALVVAAAAFLSGQDPLPDLAVPGKWSEAHRRLFTPLGAPPDAYIVKVLPSPMAASRHQVMQALGVADPASGGTAPAAAPVSGPWAVKRLEVAEAFGASGPYEPVKLARLFNGRRVEVSRGPVLRHGRAVASVTLISPYPDPTLSRIEPGTLIIVLRL